MSDPTVIFENAMLLDVARGKMVPDTRVVVSGDTISRVEPMTAEANFPDNVKIMEMPDVVWYNLHEPDARGLAAPVKRLLDKLR